MERCFLTLPSGSATVIASCREQPPFDLIKRKCPRKLTLQIAERSPRRRGRARSGHLSCAHTVGARARAKGGGSLFLIAIFRADPDGPPMDPIDSMVQRYRLVGDRLVGHYICISVSYSRSPRQSNRPCPSNLQGSSAYPAKNTSECRRN